MLVQIQFKTYKQVEKMQRCPAFGRRLTSYSRFSTFSQSYLPCIYPEINKKRVLYVFIPWLWFSASGEHGKSELKLTITHTFPPLLPIYFVSSDEYSCAKGLIRRWLAERNQKPIRNRHVESASQTRPNAATTFYLRARLWSARFKWFLPNYSTFVDISFYS